MVGLVDLWVGEETLELEIREFEGPGRWMMEGGSHLR